MFEGMVGVFDISGCGAGWSGCRGGRSSCRGGRSGDGGGLTLFHFCILYHFSLVSSSDIL